MKYEEPMMDVTVLRKRNVVTVASGMNTGTNGDGDGEEWGDEWT